MINKGENLKKIALFFSAALFSQTLIADCTLNETSQTDAHAKFEEASALYKKQDYATAYDTLNESFKLYSGTEAQLNVTYSCINYVPGPYAPIIKKSTDTGVLKFDRVSLGKTIKQYLNPNPYVLIQYQPRKTVVSVLNSKKTARGEIANQLDLENFSVSVDGRTLNFGNVKSGETKTDIIARSTNVNSSVSTKELYGYNLYK